MSNLSALLTSPSLTLLLYFLTLLPLSITASDPPVLHLPVSRTYISDFSEKFEFLLAADDGLSLDSTPYSLIQTHISNYQDIQYFVTLHFGQIREPFRVLIDTGSSWLWIPNELFSGRKFLHKYACRQELGCITLDETRMLKYGLGVVEGVVVQDQVCLSPNGNCVDDQVFVLVTSQKDFNGIEGEGILGLGFKEEVDGHEMLLNTLKDQGVIERRVFSLYLKGSGSQHEHSGILTLGGVNRDIVGNQEIVYEDVLEGKFWAVKLDAAVMRVFGSPYKVWKQGTRAIIDSGTSCLHVPYGFFNQFMQEISSLSGVHFERVSSRMKSYDCSKGERLDRFPIIEFILKGKTFRIKPEDYIMRREDSCFILLQSSPLNDTWVLGDVFMHTVYTVFDFEEKRVGFVQIDGVESNALLEWQIPTGELVAVILCGVIIAVVVVVWSIRNLMRMITARFRKEENKENMIEIATTIIGGNTQNGYAKNVI